MTGIIFPAVSLPTAAGFREFEAWTRHMLDMNR